MDEPDLREQIRRAALRASRADAARERAIRDRDDLIRRGRAAGIGPSELARLTKMTREWVSAIAPRPRPGTND